MIIVKADCINVSDLPEKAEPILFYIYGTYFYVTSGIVDNELRTLKHWRIIERPSDRKWVIVYQQGVQIPQELGDYLVAHQDIRIEAQKLIDVFDEIAQKQDDLLGHGLQRACENWDEATDNSFNLAGLKRALARTQGNNQTTDEAEQTEEFKAGVKWAEEQAEQQRIDDEESDYYYAATS